MKQKRSTILCSQSIFKKLFRTYARGAREKMQFERLTDTIALGEDVFTYELYLMTISSIYFGGSGFPKSGLFGGKGALVKILRKKWT